MNHHRRNRATRSRSTTARPAARRTALTGAVVAVGAVPVAALTAFAAPVSATPTPSAVLSGSFPVQCVANGASTVTGTVTLSAAGPASAAVGDTVTVSQYTVKLALANLPMNDAPFKGATPSWDIDGTFTSHTVLTGAMNVGPVATTGPLQRATMSPNGAVTFDGAASAPISFTATADGPVVVTSASPLKLALSWYLTKVTPAAGNPALPAGIPSPNASKPYGTSDLSCTGNPVKPWGTVQVVAASTQTVVGDKLASTGSATTNLAFVAGWVLTAGVGVTFFARRRRLV